MFQSFKAIWQQARTCPVGTTLLGIAAACYVYSPSPDFWTRLGKSLAIGGPAIALGNAEYSSRNRNNRARQSLPYLRKIISPAPSLTSNDTLADTSLPLATEQPDLNEKTAKSIGKQ